MTLTVVVVGFAGFEYFKLTE